MRKAWTDAEREAVREKYPQGDLQELAASLGRTVFSVMGQARLLGLIRLFNGGHFNRKHGYANPNNPTYNSWWSMRQRCEDPGHKSYQRYGGRGISVCAAWKDFACFLADMGERPDRSYSIGRIDNERNYEPGNCRWETQKQQQNNRCSSKPIAAFGKTQTLSLWADELGVQRSTLEKRLMAGWAIERALTTPVATRWRKAADGTHPHYQA